MELSIIPKIIKDKEQELEELTQKYEYLSDKGQLAFDIAQKIEEKRKELENMRLLL